MSYLRNQPYDEKDFPAFAAIREQLGFLPNFFVEQTARPDMVATEIAMTDNLIVKEDALPRRQNRSRSTTFMPRFRSLTRPS